MTKIKKYEYLPKNAKIYLEKLKEILEMPIAIVSVEPDREQTIFRK